ncbi:MAG: hypothetical protein VKO65_09040 [Cyanobacteriota bacterium]|nr:hypothetical protein [Cyanobacteriota bacterium]
MPPPPLSIAAFALTGLAVIGNDALQTLGPFLAANRGRTPRLLQWLWLATLLTLVLVLGWWRGGGDPAWGRLATFPEARTSWTGLLPALSVLLLTRCGAPVSTSVLVLTAFAPASLGPLLRHSLVGYGAGLAAGLLAWGTLLLLNSQAGSGSGEAEQPGPGASGAEGSGPRPPWLDTPGAERLWLSAQWLTTGWLWCQWLVQDLATIYVVLPRRLSAGAMAGSLVLLLVGLALILGENGGAIQQRLTRKSRSDDPRSTAILTAVYGLVLFGLGRLSSYPLSTTWVFLGLLGGRELALLRLKERNAGLVLADLAGDLLRAALGMGLSVAVTLAVRHGLA